ncbi:SpoIIIAC/SpoIIIAD family protein [Lacrimispora sp. 210928-DFI.3.58]|uniref:SpoIIIAC/SpoIIIAD family protein n=1 Tax=Lacrimispora sp. 210928-DFI.3.58 TaxID=2883214 RepID=UPI001D0782E3|nr:SpoIIIAC/SpoIIIAD family protein [Lacrimispora sp. 210928-DFI.3.58]MCB7317225.1 stage III sporulation protein AD [Lacrimispora sp. 210928-DFI.3.58]
MTIVAIGAAAVAVILMAVQMKSIRGEYAVYMVMAAGCFIFFYGTGKLAVILDTLRQIQSYINIDNVYLGTLLKMIGITYVAEFTSGICRDAGYGALGNQIEIFGKLSILGISMPVLLALFGVLERFLR